MRMRKKKFTKFMSLTLAAILVAGVVTVMGMKKINSKADSINQTKVEMDDSVKALIQKYRKSNTEITINTVDDLYSEFNKRDTVDSNTAEELLAMSSDEVIVQFINDEMKNSNKISNELLSGYNAAKNLNAIVEDSSYIKNVDISYYKKGNDSFKKVITATDKYGINTTIELIDESEDDINNISRGDGWTSHGKHTETHTKAYGDRCFSYKHSIGVCSVISRFGYKISDKGITTRYIEGDVTNYTSPVIKVAVASEVITDSSAKAIGENIDGHVRYRITLLSALYGGADVTQEQHNMVVTIKKWNKAKKNMVVEEYVNHLEKIGG